MGAKARTGPRPKRRASWAISASSRRVNWAMDGRTVARAIVAAVSGARAHLVDEHLHLARAVAAQVKKQVSPRLELDDLVSYGVQGLLEAAERFDDKHG